MVENYRLTREWGFWVEEEWFGAPWIDPRGKEGIFSNDREYVRWIEVQSFKEVDLITGSTEEELDAIRHAINLKNIKSSRQISLERRLQYSWRNKLIQNGEILENLETS